MQPPRDRLTVKERMVAILVWQGLTNRDIAGRIHTSEQVVKNHLRSTFDKLGVWSRLELALYVASHGGAAWESALGIGLDASELDGASLSVPALSQAQVVASRNALARPIGGISRVV